MDREEGHVRSVDNYDISRLDDGLCSNYNSVYS